MTDSKRAWMVRITGSEKLCDQHSIVAIGWSKATGLNSSPSRQAIKNEVGKHYDWYTSHGLGNVAGTIQRFIFQIQPGDLVAVVSGHKAGFRIAQVEAGLDGSQLADYRSDLAEYDCAWSRPVKYLTPWLSRSEYLPGRVETALKGRQTCLEMSQYLSHLQSVSTNQTKISDLSDQLSEDLATDILKTLRTHLNDRQLESLVCDLAVRSGATSAWQPGRSTRAPGDVDVEAIYSVQYGKGEKAPRVLYQVKQHHGQTDRHAVQQLIDRSESENSPNDVAALVVVSTAEDFSDDAERLAEASDVELMAGRDLVDWILKTGLGVASY